VLPREGCVACAAGIAEDVLGTQTQRNALQTDAWSGKWKIEKCNVIMCFSFSRPGTLERGGGGGKN
jgi:hypothetical protein